MQRPKDTMALDLYWRVVDEYIDLGGEVVSLTPIVGDPLIDRHLFDRLDYLASRSEIRRYYFYTNAILLKPAAISRLLEHDRRLRVYVSIGGFDRETYRAIMGVDAFTVVRSHLEELAAARRASSSDVRITLTVRCPVSACRGPFWEACSAWHREGLLDIEAVTRFDSWAGKVAAGDLRAAGLVAELPPHKRGACELLFAKPVVLADGRVNACACRDVEAELVIGDLNQTSLAEVWSGEALADLVERHERGDYPDVCKRCTWYNSIYNTSRRNARVGRGGFDRGD